MNFLYFLVVSFSIGLQDLVAEGADIDSQHHLYDRTHLMVAALDDHSYLLRVGFYSQPNSFYIFMKILPVFLTQMRKKYFACDIVCFPIVW